MNKQITVVIVHWNTPTHLKKQLQALSPQQNNLHIVVVDNASKDPLLWVKKQYPSIILIENKINRGFGAACNQGTLHEEGEWLLFLNPDVEIDQHQINEMIAYAEKQHYDAACPASPKKEYNKSVPSMLSLLAEFTPLKRLFPLPLFPFKTLTGGCLLIKRKVFEDLGGFDERFFLWFEDSDLTYRLLKSNYSIGTIPISVVHEGGGSFKHLSTQYKRDIFFHSMHVYAQKHFHFLGRLIVSLIKKKYSARKLLPVINDHISITIPNMKESLLMEFFSHNQQCLFEIDELIVVSNALNNETVWQWRETHPTVRFIPIEKNRGFAATVNIGFNVSTGSWVGTINDDVIMGRNWIKQCLVCADKNTGSINPVVFKQNGQIESAGITILKRGKAEPLRTILQNRACFAVNATNACAVVYRKEALNKVGLFDEQFGSYLEDIDLSLRLKRNGFANMVSTQSTIIHYGQLTSRSLGRKKRWYDARNWIYVILKNWSIIELIKNTPSIIMERMRNVYSICK